MITASDRPREFELRAKEFNFIAAEIKERTGIVLGEQKRDMVYGRLVRRLRELKLPGFEAYCAYLQGPQGADELGTMINALTTNLTAFFREPHHFEHLKEVMLPELAARASDLGRRLRIWSSACSSGEEAHSIAMTLLGARVDLRRWDVRILATDLDTNMLANASRATYPAAAADKIPAELRHRFTEPAGELGKVRVTSAARDLITFKQLNLLEPWPMKGPFDVIFCRNVLIYFDTPTKAALVSRMTDLLRPGGWLCLGHSETLLTSPPELNLVGRTIYRRVA